MRTLIGACTHCGKRQSMAVHKNKLFHMKICVFCNGNFKVYQ